MTKIKNHQETSVFFMKFFLNQPSILSNSLIHLGKKVITLLLIGSFLLPDIASAMYERGEVDHGKRSINQRISLKIEESTETEESNSSPQGLSSSDERNKLSFAPFVVEGKSEECLSRKTLTPASDLPPPPETPQEEESPDSEENKKSSNNSPLSATAEPESLGATPFEESSAPTFGVKLVASASRHEEEPREVYEEGPPISTPSDSYQSYNGLLGEFPLWLFTDQRGNIQDTVERRPLLEGKSRGKASSNYTYDESSGDEYPREWAQLPHSGHVVALDPNNHTDARVLAFLRYADRRIKRGLMTPTQVLLGAIGGTLIGIGVGNAMPAILADGLSGLGDSFNYEIGWTPFMGYFFTSHTAITLGIDSIFRNAQIISKLSGPSTEKFSILGNKPKIGCISLDPRIGLQLIVFGGAAVTALLPVYYLWQIAKEDTEAYEKGKEGYYTFFWCLAPTLWLDSLFSNARGLQDWIDEKINTVLIRQAFAGSDLSSARQIRKETLERFENLERLFRSVPDSDICAIYEDIFRNSLNTKNGDHLPEILEAGEGLRTLKALIAINKTYHLSKKYVKERGWKTWVSAAAGLGIPVLATIGRSLVFYTIIYDMSEDLGLDSEIGRAFLAGLLGGGIASTFQGKMEINAVKSGVYEILNGENTEGDASHNYIRSVARKAGKGYNHLQGMWNTLPYILVGIAATAGWPVAIQVTTLLFFGVADMFNNALSFNASYGGAMGGVESLASYGYPTTAHQRNKLLRMVRGYIKTYKIMPPEVLMRSHQLESYTGNSDSINAQVLDIMPRIHLNEEEA